MKGVHRFPTQTVEVSMNENHKAPDTRDVFIWHGRDRDEDLNRLASVIARKAINELFNEDGHLVHLHGGRLIAVNKEDMREIVNRHVRTLRLVDRGTADAPQLEVEYFSLAFPIAGSKYDLNRGPNERTLIDLIDALVPLVARAPRAPVEFKPQQLHEIKLRLKSGEPAYIIARSYGVELDVIQEMERARWS
jgi:hypothetical protein